VILSLPGLITENLTVNKIMNYTVDAKSMITTKAELIFVI